jgi:hypothetical protein
VAGEVVKQGQQIGLSGDTGPGIWGHPHLHFEVLRLIPGRPNDYYGLNYAVVDPYGWTGNGTDPLSMALSSMAFLRRGCGSDYHLVKLILWIISSWYLLLDSSCTENRLKDGGVMWDDVAGRGSIAREQCGLVRMFRS